MKVDQTLRDLEKLCEIEMSVPETLTHFPQRRTRAFLTSIVTPLVRYLLRFPFSHHGTTVIGSGE